MVAKCGPRVMHHWAHAGRRNCDPWWENETPWHREWKNLFPEDCREVSHTAPDGEVHRADIKTPAGIVIEVQHSNMTDSIGATAWRERALAEYLNRKHLAQASKGQRDPTQVPIADVLALYGKAKAASQSRPKETAGRIGRLLGFFGDKMLCEINGDLCRAYVEGRSTDAAASLRVNQRSRRNSGPPERSARAFSVSAAAR
jgi:hypothetical protein